MILDIKNLCCRYSGRREDTLRHVDFSLEEGEMVLLAGQSGCGKSTLIQAVTGLLGESGGHWSGRIVLNGRDLHHMTPEEIGLIAGTVYQTPDDQLFAMTAMDETIFALENRGVPHDDAVCRGAKILERVGLGGLGSSSIMALSGGQRQRLALASVLVTHPRLLILDEPVSQMNPQGVYDFLELLRSLNREEGMSILAVEHRVNEMAPWFSRLAVLYKGSFVYDGSMEAAWQTLGDAERYGLREPQTVSLGRALHLPVLSSSVEKTASLIRSEGFVIKKAAAKGVRKELSGPLFLEGRCIRYRYADQKEDTLRDIGFSLRKGTITALMGFNGAGKSTLMNLLGGLEDCSSGKILLEGRPLKKQQGRTGYLRQEADLMLLTDTVHEELMWKNPGFTEPESDALLRQLRLRHYRNDFPLALSKGQRLRLVLGAMLAKKADLLLLDEPTTGQDQNSLSEIRRLLCLAASEGRTVFFCTHDMELVASLADQVLVLSQGRLIGSGCPEEVLGNRDLLKRGGLSMPPMLRLSEILGIEDCITEKEVLSHVHPSIMGRGF